MTPFAKEKITKARAGLVLDQPFFGSLTLRLALQEDPACDTAWTDGVTLGYNPTWIDSLPLPVVKAVLAHEVMHLAAEHQARRGGRDPKRWNIAADLAINPLLQAAGFSLPDDALMDPGCKDMAAEQIFAGLPEPDPQGQDGQTAGQPGDMGTGGGIPGAGPPTPADKSDPGGMGEVRDAPAPDGGTPGPADLTKSAADWKIAVAQAAQQARAMGEHLPDALARMVEEIINPKIDWREALRRFISTLARNDYSWTPPNRRYIHQGIYLPSLRSEKLGELVVAVDTSGSISPRDLDQFAAELTAIMEEHPGTEAHVVYCDTAIRGAAHVTADDLPLTLEPRGGGGTDFRPPFAWVEEQQIDPVALIYLTDMECSRFPDAPEYPVLWVRTGTGGRSAPFGEVIDL